MANRYGTLGADSLNGTSTDDYISGGPLGNEAADTGNDTLNGGSGGFDRIFGWGGNDSITAFGFGSVVDGGSGNDTLNAGDDVRALGGDGNDLIFVTNNVSILPSNGGAGNDTLIATGLDLGQMEGGSGADSLVGGDGRNDLYDGAFFDFFFNTDSDTLFGGAGDDGLYSRGGADRLDGGSGEDFARIDRSGSTANFSLRIGAATATSTASDGTTVTGVERFELNGGSGRDKLTANAGDDTLRGNEGNDNLNGGKGADNLQGGDGADTLIGGAGADQLSGGLNADAFRWTALDRRSNDQVGDFNRGLDRLEFSAGALGDLLPIGALDAANFALEAASAAAPQFIYRAGAQTLLWDADGSGSGKAISIAFFVLQQGALSAADIVIIA